MRRSVFLSLALAGFASLFPGCGRIADYGTIVKANRDHDMGLYQEAATAYLKVRSRAFLPTVDYDLANVYARLGEYEAAAELYARAREEGSFRSESYFNEGVVLYEKGRYEEAWRAFRSSLARESGARLDPAFVRDARRNLEIAWRAWKKRSVAQSESISASSRGSGGPDEEELRLFRRLETGEWRPGKRAEPEAAVDDY